MILKRSKIMRLFVISDIHGDRKHIKKAARHIRAADRVIIAGDISRNGDPEDALNFLYDLEQYTSGIIAVHGNWDDDTVIDYLVHKMLLS